MRGASFACGRRLSGHLQAEERGPQTPDIPTVILPHSRCLQSRSRGYAHQPKAEGILQQGSRVHPSYRIVLISIVIMLIDPSSLQLERFTPSPSNTHILLTPIPRLLTRRRRVFLLLVLALFQVVRQAPFLLVVPVLPVRQVPIDP